jgi:hypothetical protein
MGQRMLLPVCVSQERWQPVVPPFPLRRLARITRWKPLPGQLFLPGMGPTEEDGGGAAAFNDEGLTPDRELATDDVGLQPTCPNCGGAEFDEDGDCTSCWEPAVVKPAGGRAGTAPSHCRRRGPR